MKLTGFDANDYDDMNSFEPLPAGKYLAAIVASEEKQNSKGTGSYLELKFEIIEGDHKGRYLWTRLNLEHPNREVVRIANIELGAICKAVGVLTPGDSRDLHDRPLVVSVKIRKRSDTGEAANDIKGYFRRDTASVRSDDPPW